MKTPIPLIILTTCLFGCAHDTKQQAPLPTTPVTTADETNDTIPEKATTETDTPHHESLEKPQEEEKGSETEQKIDTEHNIEAEQTPEPACQPPATDQTQPFSIIVLPDTQHYTMTESGIYQKQMQWIVDHQKSENIQFVLHLGDVTNNNINKQWQIASDAHKLLEDACIPYVVSTGNHDYLKSADANDNSNFGRSRSLFKYYFNQKRFYDQPWIKQIIDDTNIVAEFKIGELQFLVVAIEYSPRKDIMCQLDQIIQKYPNHHVIVTTHALLKRGATEKFDRYAPSHYAMFVSFGATGSETISELIDRHSNIFMAISGHVTGSEHRMHSHFKNTHQYAELLVDYQAEGPCRDEACLATSCDDQADGGNGWLHQITIYPKAERQSDGSLAPNVFVKPITVLENDQFVNQKPAFYCSEMSPAENRNYYDAEPTGADHTYAFTYDFDAVGPYRYDVYENNTNFGIRNINTQSEGQHTNARVAVAPDGTFVSVWTDEQNGQKSIHARGFCRGGCSQWPEFAVTDGTHDADQADITLNAQNQSLITWLEHGQVFGMRVSATGERLGEAIQLTPVNLHAQTYAMHTNAAGETVIIWLDDAQRVFHTRLSANDARTTPVKIAQNAATTRPDVAMDTDGSFIVSWTELAADGSRHAVARLFAPDAAPQGNVIKLNSTTSSDQAVVAISATGERHIVYVAENGDAHPLLITTLDAQGHVLRQNMAVTPSDEFAQQPDVSTTGNQVVITWSAPKIESGNVRMVRIQNGVLKTIYTVSSIQEFEQRHAQVGCNATNNCVFVFEDDNDRDGRYQIFARGTN